MDGEKLKRWILVTDNDAVSQKQMQVCDDIKPPLYGALDCSVVNEDICREVGKFPAFCNLDTKVCLFGLRMTENRFVEMQNMSGEKE